MFGYGSNPTDAQIESLLSRYSKYGRPLAVDFRKLVPTLRNPDRATHMLHPYPAKLLVHIPYFFLNNSLFSQPGDLVADPFCGSGTVLLESTLSGRAALGADSNPFARLLSKVKTQPISRRVLNGASERLLQRLPSKPSGPPPDVVNLEYWFYPHIIRQLQCLHEAIQATRSENVRDFFLICLSNCARRVSLADPRLSVPVRLHCGTYPEGHHLRLKMEAHLRRLRRVNVAKVFEAILSAGLERMNAFESRCPEESTYSLSQDARKLNAVGRTAQNKQRLRSNSVQLVITSPPYPGAQKYIRASTFSLGWLGLCTPDELLDYKLATIGREEFRKSDYETLEVTGVAAADRKLQRIHSVDPVRAAIASTYLKEMREAFQETYRVLKPGGYLVLVAANNYLAGQNFKTQDYLRRIAEDLGLSLQLRLIDDIRSRGLMTKRNKTASVIASEWVLVFRKEVGTHGVAR